MLTPEPSVNWTYDVAKDLYVLYIDVLSIVVKDVQSEGRLRCCTFFVEDVDKTDYSGTMVSNNNNKNILFTTTRFATWRHL